MIEWLGTEYGGWYVDLGLVPSHSTVLSAGIGEDISFDIEMINRKNCTVVGIDPTQKAAEYCRAYPIRHFSLIEKALWKDDTEVRMYRNKLASQVSESVEATDRGVSGQWYMAKAISVPTLLKKYPNPSILKMDIEGAEYAVLNSLTELKVPQVCVEFHHRYIDARTEQDTIATKQHLCSLGYHIVVDEDHGVLFIKD